MFQPGKEPDRLAAIGFFVQCRMEEQVEMNLYCIALVMSGFRLATRYASLLMMIDHRKIEMSVDPAFELEGV